MHGQQSVKKYCNAELAVPGVSKIRSAYSMVLASNTSKTDNTYRRRHYDISKRPNTRPATKKASLQGRGCGNLKYRQRTPLNVHVCSFGLITNTHKRREVLTTQEANHITIVQNMFGFQLEQTTMNNTFF
jgi:hypothetical protein